MTATLLAIDDSKTMRKVLEITFAGENYRTVLSESASDALAKLRSERPAIVLLDAILGESNGYEICQKIKAEAPGVGVIILSSKQHPYDRTRGSAAGADDFIDKPFDTQALIDKVAGLVQRLGEVAARPAPAPAARPAPAPAVAPAPGCARSTSTYDNEFRFCSACGHTKSFGPAGPRCNTDRSNGSNSCRGSRSKDRDLKPGVEIARPRFDSRAGCGRSRPIERRRRAGRLGSRAGARRGDDTRRNTASNGRMTGGPRGGSSRICA